MLVAAGAVAVGGLHLDNARLRTRVADSHRQRERLERLREENRRAQEIVKRSQTDETGAARAVHDDVVRVRGEVAALEKRAAEQHARLTAKTAAEAETLANNRDPQKGLTRLEHFQNLGQGTPGAAWQTLVWGALKGDDAVLAQVITISAPALAKAEALIAGLPEGARAQWTPEKLAAMFFTGAFNEVTAAQVMTENTKDAQHVELRVRLKSGTKEPIIPFQWELGAKGWQVVFEEKFLGAVRKKIAGAEGPSPKK